MASFTCPVCEHVNTIDPPNGEWWSDSDTIEAQCSECDANLDVHVCVEIILSAEVDRGA